jgi:hypothetical protein
MRLPLPRIQGGAPAPRVVTNPRQRYPLVYGPSVGAENTVTPQEIPPVARASLPPTQRIEGSPAGFADVASYLNYGLGQRPLHPVLPARQEVDQTPWRQVAPTMPMYGGGGIYAGQEQRMEPGSPAERRGVEPPSADYPGMLARNGELVRGTEAPTQYGDEDLAWNAARARVQAEMGRQSDPTGMRAAREGYLRPYSARAQRAQMIADGRARMGRPSR